MLVHDVELWHFLVYDEVELINQWLLCVIGRFGVSEVCVLRYSVDWGNLYKGDLHPPSI